MNYNCKILILVSLICLLILVGTIVYFCILKNKENLEDKYINNKKNIKICILITGFAPRSFKYTYKSIENNIINILKNKNYIVDIYHHSLLDKNEKIDSYRNEEKNLNIKNNDSYLLKCKKIITEFQDNIMLPNISKCKMYKGYSVKQNEYNFNAIKNHYRALYSEYKAINEFPINNYDVCIMLTSDALIKKEINLNEILDVYKNKNIIYTTKFNNSGYIANGFYISNSENLKIICNRIKLFNEYCSKVQNAEEFLKLIINKYKLNNKDSEMFYWKIRANGQPNWYSTIKI
jgi:hypothetical protein